MGSFSVSYIGLTTMFRNLSSTEMSQNFRNMLEYRKVISERLGGTNPYTAGLPDPLDPEYSKGYGRYSQDVVIPAFVAAYTGKNPRTAPLILYEDRTNKNNPFRNFMPMPNWNLRYNGLTKIPGLQDKVRTLTISHTYSGNLSMNNFMSHLFYQDFLGVGFPSFIDSVSGNYIPYFMVPNMTISEQFSPLLGIDMQLANSLSLKITYNKSRTLSLSLVDYQVSETNSSEIMVGCGYRIQGLNMPFSIFGVNRLENDINIKVDVGLRDDITVNSYMATETITATRGQRVLTINPRIDYIINDALQIQLFFDRRQSIPYVQQTFPLTSTRAGVTLRYIFTEGFGF
ncbi:MAG: cell surface protein SprA [Taibaiella sp.]|nr:cell surface protein SprA [Taibaiella sp.]